MTRRTAAKNVSQWVRVRPESAHVTTRPLLCKIFFHSPSIRSQQCGGRRFGRSIHRSVMPLTFSLYIEHCIQQQVPCVTFCRSAELVLATSHSDWTNRRNETRSHPACHSQRDTPPRTSLYHCWHLRQLSQQQRFTAARITPTSRIWHISSRSALGFLAHASEYPEYR